MKKITGSDLRSNLGRARGLGSAKHGVSHWWFQRVTAVAMIPLLIWFTASVIAVTTSPDVNSVARWFSSPINSLLMVLLFCAMFYHAKLGLQVVIEDYVKAPCCKYSLLFGNIFFCVAGAIICIAAVLKLHLFGIN
jgi:succinate dehydrogenase / fumarate reductase, membrane anchor subunit